MDRGVDDSRPRYILALGYLDGPAQLELDLPGGKRHLGESTLQGLLREVEEECSLRIDEGWLASKVTPRYGGRAIRRDGEAGGEDGHREGDEYDGARVRTLEPRKIKGVPSGDAFFVMPPPPPAA